MIGPQRGPATPHQIEAEAKIVRRQIQEVVDRQAVEKIVEVATGRVSWLGSGEMTDAELIEKARMLYVSAPILASHENSERYEMLETLASRLEELAGRQVVQDDSRLRMVEAAAREYVEARDAAVAIGGVAESMRMNKAARAMKSLLKVVRPEST